jgi:hypothetical protein
MIVGVLVLVVRSVVTIGSSATDSSILRSIHRTSVQSPIYRRGFTVVVVDRNNNNPHRVGFGTQQQRCQ